MWMLSKILRQSRDSASLEGRVLVFWCPACKSAHAVHVEKPNHCGAVWSWNGDVDKPTFSPPLNCWPNSDTYRCHSFIRNGMIEYLNDCGHDMKGQTVSIPEWPGLWDDES